MCVRICACVCAHACVCESVHACVCLRECACVCVCVRKYVFQLLRVSSPGPIPVRNLKKKYE